MATIESFPIEIEHVEAVVKYYLASLDHKRALNVPKDMVCRLMTSSGVAVFSEGEVVGALAWHERYSDVAVVRFFWTAVDHRCLLATELFRAFHERLGGPAKRVLYALWDTDPVLEGVLLEFGFCRFSRQRLTCDIRHMNLGSSRCNELIQTHSLTTSFDASALADLLRECYANTFDASIFPFLSSDHGCAAYFEDIRSGMFGHLESDLSFIARCSITGRLVAGLLMVRKGASRILFCEQLFVMSAWRRRGVATALLLKLVETAQNLGCLTVELVVSRDNTSAATFYRRAGFTLLAEEPVWILASNEKAT